MKTKCSCGKPLHYKDENTRQMVQNLIDELGECVRIESAKGAWLVPRHFVALHGVAAADLPYLAKKYNFKKTK